MKLFSILLLLPLATQAATISGITVSNLSTADYTISTNTQVAEFRSANQGTTPISVNGNISSFTNQFSWFLGQSAFGGVSGNTIASAVVSYELSFTVLDPTNSGYILYAESELHGWLTAQYDPLNTSGSSIFARSGDLNVEVSRNGLYNLAPNLSAGESNIFVDELSPNTNELILSGGNTQAALQIGTQSFSLRVRMAQSGVVALAEAQGEAGLRFGLEPLLDFFYIKTPGEDGETASQLGHFTTISMLSFEPAAEVPEPGYAIPIAMAFLFYQRRRSAS
ncbi:MAG: hypothetical protein NTW74_16180 [Acidobacteria bacterium]|nr:hypothetical protein [Acidobacteriota bacterium]